jgi:23S rRNA pseudouridine1911/1915/1917 synthase
VAKTAEGRKFSFDGPPERLDKYLAKKLVPASRTQVQRWIEEGHVTVNNLKAPSSLKLASGDAVSIVIPPFSSLPAAAADSIPVLFEDDDIVVVNKPAGIPVHPAGPHQKDTLIQRLWPKLAAGWESVQKKAARAAAIRPGVVHRLDKGTSGVMVIAKNPVACEKLSKQFAKRTIKKVYRALARGVPQNKTMHITSSVGRSRRSPHKMSTAVPGRLSETDVQVLQNFPHKIWPSTYLEVNPLTGRTHQIRVQLAAMGHPLWGDGLYDLSREKKSPFEPTRPLLHALKLSFVHPVTGKTMSFEAPLPPDFAAALASLAQ